MCRCMLNRAQARPSVGAQLAGLGGSTMPVRVIALGMFILSLIVPTAAALAQAGRNPLFTVSGVATEATAESAAAARQPALTMAEKAALQIMLRRLTLAADQSRLPTVDDARLQALVRSIQVQDERTAGNRYIARVNVGFDPVGIRALLRDAGIPFTEAVSKPLLMIPVFDSDGRRMLWEESNPWRQAWINAGTENGLLPISLPIGDAADNDGLNATQAASLDEPKIRQLAERYKLSDIAVASATLRRGGADSSLQVTVTRLGSSNEATLVLSFPVKGDAVTPAMDDAVRDIVGRLEERWKQVSMLKPTEGGPTKLSALVPLSGLADWITVKERLGRVSGISRFDVVAITKKDAQVQFTFPGDAQQLVLLMAQRDLDLAQGSEGYWTLRLKGSR